MVHMRKVHSLKANEAKIVLGQSKNNEEITADMITERGFSQYCSPAFVDKFEVLFVFAVDCKVIPIFYDIVGLFTRIWCW